MRVCRRASADAICAGYVAYSSPVELVFTFTNTDFQLLTSTGFDSGPVLWAGNFPTFTPADLGTTPALFIGADDDTQADFDFASWDLQAAAAVPEPGTVLPLMALGLAFVASRRRAACE